MKDRRIFNKKDLDYLNSIGADIQQHEEYEKTGRRKPGRKDKRVRQLDKSSFKWFNDAVKARGVKIIDIYRFMGIDKKNFYLLLHDPMSFSTRELVLLSFRSKIPLRDIYSWVHKQNYQTFIENDKLWFEED